MVMYYIATKEFYSMKKILYSVGFLIFCIGIAFSEELPSLIVFNISAEEGVSKGKANLLTEILIDEINKLNLFKVIGQKDLDSMLFWEGNKQLKNCTESSCLTQIAGAMGAEYYVEGSVGEMGDKYVIAIKLMNAQKVEVINRLIKKVYKSDNVLLDEVPRIVKELFDPKKLKKEMEDVKGEVFFTSGLDIVSEPSGVRLIIDNEDKGVTPLKIEKMRNGRHIIVARKEGYKDETITVSLNKDEIKPLMIKLVKKVRSIYVDSKPDKAEVYFNNKKYFTPAKIEDVAPGKYQVRFYHKKYGERKAEAVVSEDQEETKVFIDFEATATEIAKKYRRDVGDGYLTTDVFYSFGSTFVKNETIDDFDTTVSHIIQGRIKANLLPVVFTPQIQALYTSDGDYSVNFALTLYSTRQFELLTLGAGMIKMGDESKWGLVYNIFRLNFPLQSSVDNGDLHIFLGILDSYILSGEQFIGSYFSLGLGWGFYMY